MITKTPASEKSDVVIEYDRKVVKKVVKKRVIIKKEAPHIWPYSDTYAPKLQHIEDDKKKLKQRLHAANVKGLLAFDQMQVRKNDIYSVEE
jgi:hypothetical protein